MSRIERTADAFMAIVEACSKMTRAELELAGAAVAAGWLTDAEREALAPLCIALTRLARV